MRQQISCQRLPGIPEEYQLHGKLKFTALHEEDLWQQIFDILDGSEELLRVRWMPSHLDDPKDIKKQAIQSGLISEEDKE